jgi:hypothetical protein
MKKVSVSQYVDGVNSIYVEKPSYETGHDGSDGKCDCIGMCRGGLKRAGATDVIGMSGTNYAARYTIKDLKKIDSVNSLKVGDVVLKTRPADDPTMPLPDKYKKSGAAYNGDLTNYTHIGTVTHVNPLEITHMTSPTAKKDNKLGKWVYVGWLPWVTDSVEPSPEPVEPQTATVWAEHGTTVKMRAKPSTSCKTYWDIPIGTTVIVDVSGDEWSQITCNGRTGYMMTKFLVLDGVYYTVTIPHLTMPDADNLVKTFPGAVIEEERG